MKAIIVIDLNNTTLKEWDTDTSKCWAEIKVYTPIKGGAHGIGCVCANNYVELKPMPNTITHYEVKASFDYDEDYALGYNKCIDEILGDIEDE